MAGGVTESITAEGRARAAVVPEGVAGAAVTRSRALAAVQVHVVAPDQPASYAKPPDSTLAPIVRLILTLNPHSLIM